MFEKYKYFVLILFVLGTIKVFGQNNTLFKVNVQNIKSSNDIQKTWLLPVFVDRVIDGDTIVVKIDNPPQGLNESERVRFLGVDTPETVHPNKVVQWFGKEASEYTKKMLEKKKVYLAFDWDLRDIYKRLLAYIYLEDGTCFNAKQVRDGYAHAYTRYPFQFMDEFKRYENNARLKKIGLWK